MVMVAAVLAAAILLLCPRVTAVAEEAQGISLQEDLYHEIEQSPSQESSDVFAVSLHPPSGTGTVIDYATDNEGRLFYTIETKDQSVFYLIIDKQRSMENVYFLRSVSIVDLAALTDMPIPQHQQAIKPSPAEETSELPAAQPATQELPAAPEQSAKSKLQRLLVPTGILAILCGTVGWYIKVYRPRKRGALYSDEYEPPDTDTRSGTDLHEEEQEVDWA